MNMTPERKEFVNAATEMFGAGAVLTRNDVNSVAKKYGLKYPSWFTNSKNGYRAEYGKYSLPTEEGMPSSSTAPSVSTPVASEGEPVMNLIATNLERQNLIPTSFEGFVKWGHYSTLERVVKSEMFYPTFITGLSGNGKTLMVEELHAKMRKELIRVNITIETDEDDLLGGFRLVNGETKFVRGPVIEAMERGATLLLDEIDLGSNKLMCLQPVLEGKGVYLKKVNTWVTPNKGFNVIATANTKGKGSDDGRFIGTNILNEAFLERFPVTFEQQYPSAKTEQKILNNTLAQSGKKDVQYVEKLSTWADVIRKTYFDGGVDEIISTRRLVHIVQAYSIFGNKMKAIELCTNRFDNDTKASFVDLYTKVDAGATAESIAQEQKDTALKEQMMSNDSEEGDDTEEDFV